MKTAAGHSMEPLELGKQLAEKTGAGDMIEQALREIRPLLDNAGTHAYLLVVDFFLPFDRPVSLWLLRSGAPLLSALADNKARLDVLEAILGMGKSKWSVAAEALRKLSDVSGRGPGIIVQWLKHGSSLAGIDQDAALQYFKASLPVLETLDACRFNNWASLGQEIARLSWKAAKEYFKASPEVIKKIDLCDLERWARLGIYLIEKSPSIKADYNAQSLLAAGAAAGKSKKVDLAVQYFKSAPQILGRLTMHDLEEWVAKGLETSDAQKDKGTSFFSLQTGTSLRAMEGLVKGLELKEVHTVLSAYAEALQGAKIQIRSSSLFYKNLPGLSRFLSVTDGIRVFLPSKITVFSDQELNFKIYKCALSHELSHIQFGTFALGTADIKRVLQFGNPVPAFKIFEFLEDERVDYLSGIQYPGLEKDRRLLMDSYLRLSNGSRNRSVFELLGYGISGEPGDPGHMDSTLMRLLREALSKVKAPERSAREVLDLAIQVCTALESGQRAAVCESGESYDRIFYRGILDFEMVENARSGTSGLVLDMTERFHERKIEIAPEQVGAALNRIEESEELESEVLLWQIHEDEKLGELFDQVQGVIADMEAERRIRRAVYYDEWDRRLDDYRKDWCRVREMDMPENTPAFYSRTIKENYGLVSLLRRHFGLLRPDRIKRFFREERGDDLDFDALIEAVVERHAGITPSDRVYVRREKNLRDVSVAFLVDMSYSTGDVLPSGKRIIDIEREGLVLMAEALESIGDRWAVYGFSTHYRDKVDFFVVRDFDEPFCGEVKMRFESIRPIAQTRLGAAIRHANSILAKQSSRIRLLILMSDGRPYDIDYGDADYAVEDTRRALWESRKKGVNSFCITVDKKARDYLPYMYGEANYTLIDNIETLPARLPLIYKRLTT